MTRPSFRFADNDMALTPADRAAWIAVLPLGAHEQHGPHLPFDTDTLIADGEVWAMPATIEDPKVLDEIGAALKGRV